MGERFCSLVFGMSLFFITSVLVVPCLAQDETVGGGLVAHWKFEEGAGDAVKDSSGEGNDGTIVPGNAPEMKWGTGNFAGSVSFSGDNDHFVRIPASVSLNSLKKQITVVALIYPRALWSRGSTVQRRMGKSSQSGQKSARHGTRPIFNGIHRDCATSMEGNDAP